MYRAAVLETAPAGWGGRSTLGTAASLALCAAYLPADALAELDLWGEIECGEDEELSISDDELEALEPFSFGEP